MDDLFSLLHNSEFQSLFLSPLIGAILGLLFSLFITPSQVPLSQTVVQTIVVYKTVIQQNQVKKSNENAKADNSTDGFGHLIIGFGIFAFLTLAYLKFAETIFLYVNLFTIMSFTFSLTLVVISFRKHLFLENTWRIHILVPFICMCFSMFLVYTLQLNLDLGLIEEAKKYKWIESIKFIIEHFKEPRVGFFGFQAIGLILTTLFQILCVANFIFYLALMNYSQSLEKGKNHWLRTIKIMRRFVSEKEWVNLLILFIIGGLAFILVNGFLATFLESSYNLVE